DVEASELEEAVPLALPVVAHVARVAHSVGLLRGLADERVVADHHAMLRDARHLLDRSEDVGEVMRGEPAGDRVEAGVGEWQILCARRRVGLHAGRGIDGDDRRARFPQPARDMAAARRDVEDGDARPRLAPLDDQVEILARRVDRALPIQVGPVAPDVASRSGTGKAGAFAPGRLRRAYAGHFASSTARLA